MRTPATMESELRSAVARRLGEAKFGVWFGEGVRLGVDGDSLVVGVPNGFFREWIEAHYAGSLVETGVGGGRPALDAGCPDRRRGRAPLGDVVAPPGPGDRRRKGPTVPIPIAPRPPVEYPRNQAATSPHLSPGRPLRRLEDFVTGAGNRLAHAAAVELVQSAGAAFNPLVVHGGVGLGKTHLLEGVAAGLRSRHAGLNVVSITAETFTNGFLDAMRAGGLHAFRSRYRQAGALILDDAHFLAGKRATHDEFLHTFNALMSAGAPIVLATDQHPRLDRPAARGAGHAVPGRDGRQN